MSLPNAGYLTFPHDARTALWAQAALGRARAFMSQGPEVRHGGTWCPGVDALDNAPDGSVDGVPLAGPWQSHITPPRRWHAAQLSVVLPGYPRRDADESASAHAFRRNRDAAHMDGLLPEGTDRRRHLREPHAFILGLPLNVATGSPLVVWRGSHAVMEAVFRTAFEGRSPAEWGDLDVTDVYQAARREVFARCERLEIRQTPGESVLLHRHLIHGTAPWQEAETPPEGRMIAYFRPHLDRTEDWLG